MSDVKRWKCDACKTEGQGKDLEKWERLGVIIPWYTKGILSERHLCPECIKKPLWMLLEQMRVPLKTQQDS